MRRSPIPPRKVGLARGPLNLSRKAPLARSAMRRQPAQRPQDRPNDGGWSQDTRDRVSSRSGGRCEAALDACTGAATDLHHRQRRREGDHRPVNALHLCRPCHREVHARPVASRDAGWIVSAYSRPESTPVLVRGRWVLFGADGRAS